MRLCVAGGREAATRLALITIAVAVGVGLLLATLASLNGVHSQNARYAWLETGYHGSDAPPIGTAATDATTGDPLWWRLRADYYQGEQIGRVDLAATGPNSPTPPGINTLPGPGQFYASPALTKLLRNAPAAQLAARYPGRQIGTISSAALPAPDSLIIVIGRTAADLSHDGGYRVSRISTTSPGSCHGECGPFGTDGDGLTLVLSVVAAALLFPVLIFIGGATRLSAARREQRFAAMRLVGATPGQISVISTVESAVAAIAGIAVGFGLFYALRPALAAIPFTGDPFFSTDLALSLPEILLIAIGIPVAAAVAARIALRRVNISPLGVSRRVTPRPPRARRLIPLLAGAVELGYFAYVHDIGATSHTSTSVEAGVFLVGVFLVMGGLVVAGPWLTMVGSRLLSRRANRATTLIAARRLADNPTAGFRAISGLVLALFVGTCALGIITTIVAYSGGTADATANSTGTVISEFRPGPDTASPISTIADSTTQRLMSIPGVGGVAEIRVGSESRAGQFPDLVISCAQLIRTPALGHCPPGARAVLISPDYGGGIINRSSMSDTTWHPADLSIAQLGKLPIDTVAVSTDGTVAAVERVRTVLEETYSLPFGPLTLSEYQHTNSRELNSYRQLANVVMLTSLPIAGCGLAVSIAGGLAERKRPFSLLRLAGAPLGALRRVVGLEAAAPLLITALVSAGAGLLSAQLFLRAQLHETLQPPQPQYYLIVAGGLIASLAIIASTLPLLGRLTGPDVARND